MSYDDRPWLRSYDEGVSPEVKIPDISHLFALDAIFGHRLVSMAEELPCLEVVVVTGVLDFLPRIKRILARIVKKVPFGKVSPLPGKQVLRFMDALSYYPDQPPEQITPDAGGQGGQKGPQISRGFGQRANSKVPNDRVLFRGHLIWPKGNLESIE
jgi:hypothetical protein